MQYDIVFECVKKNRVLMVLLLLIYDLPYGIWMMGQIVNRSVLQTISKCEKQIKR